MEVEAYRRTLEPVIGDRIDDIDIVDERLLRRSDPIDAVRAATIGAAIDDVRRRGKLLLVDLAGGHTLALSFGLRGWLSLDDRIAPASGDADWRTRRARRDHVRCTIDVGGRRVELEDQLRLATIELDVDEERLGIDVLDLDKRALRSLLGASSAALKSLLMDQRRIAGIGNLIADEICWQAGIDPRRAADEVTGDELDRLTRAIRRTRSRVLERGGSHHGVLIDHDGRELGRRCPRCGGEMQRVRVGSRTTFLCRDHQR